MAIDYQTYVTQIATLLAVNSSNLSFQNILSGMIDYAEQRIYRDLDLLSTVVRDTTGSLAANNRNFTLPQGGGRFVVVNAINLMSDGQRVGSLRPVSLEFLDISYPSATAPSASTSPVYFAMVTDQTVVVGPPPGSNMPVEVVGTIRPTPLSPENNTTYLTLYLPDLFIAASMIYGAGYQRDFGAQSDDPKMASSWEAQYQNLFASASIEENRKKWQSVSWTSKSPSPIAIPQRG